VDVKGREEGKEWMGERCMHYEVVAEAGEVKCNTEQG